MITWAEGVTRRKRAEFEAEQQARFVKYEMRLKRAREAL
jgi:hypothetical protein